MELINDCHWGHLSPSSLIKFSIQAATAVGSVVSINPSENIVRVKIHFFTEYSHIDYTTKNLLSKADFVEIKLSDVIGKIINQEVFIAEIGNTRGSFSIGYSILIEDTNLSEEDQKKQAYQKLYEYLKQYSDLKPEICCNKITINWNENFSRATVDLNKTILI